MRGVSSSRRGWHKVVAGSPIHFRRLFGFDNPGTVYYFQIWEPWKCILVLDLSTLEVTTMFRCKNSGSALEVYTIFEIELIGSIQFCRIYKSWKSILFSDIRTLEAYTLLGFDNPGNVYYFGPETPARVYYYRI